MGCLELVVEDPDVGEQLLGEVEAGVLCRVGRADVVEEPLRVGGVELLVDPTWPQLHEQVVEPAHDPSALVADVDVALGQEPQQLGVIGAYHGSQLGGA